MYWYLKNLHKETISRKNLYEISRNDATFREIKYNEISRYFAKLKSLSSLFRISRNKKILFRDHPSQNGQRGLSFPLQLVGHAADTRGGQASGSPQRGTGIPLEG
jgi:hypothetical protein